MITVIILSSLGTIFTCLRLYTRIWIQDWFGWDDVWVVISLLLMLLESVTVLVAEYMFYWDRHIWNIPYASMSGSSSVITFDISTLLTRSRFCKIRLRKCPIVCDGVIYHTFVYAMPLQAAFSRSVCFCEVYTVRLMGIQHRLVFCQSIPQYF